MKSAAGLAPSRPADTDGLLVLGDRLACALLCAAFIAAVLMGALCIADMPSLR